jgi:site-specific DNA recombinase
LNAAILVRDEPSYIPVGCNIKGPYKKGMAPMPRKTTRKLDGYVRVSRVGGREGDSFVSPQLQRDRIEAAARNAGGEIVEWHTDLDESGGDAERPGFVKALARVEAGETDGIVVAKLDRFARSVLDARKALRRIDDAGGVFISAEDGFDSSTPMGRFAQTMLFAMAELELERVREGWTSARTVAARRGAHMAKAPTGYNRGKDGRLVPSSDAPSIAEAFQARGRGANLSEVARLLDERGVRPAARKARKGRWSSSSARALLSNRVYLGEIRAGDVVNTDAHPPIVTLGEFEAAQQARGHTVSRSSTKSALLAGILRCESCRHALKPKTITGSGAKIYRCHRKHATGICPAPATIYATVAEPYVEQLLLDAAAERSYRPEELTRELEQAEGEVEVARAERDAFASDESILAIGRDVFVAGLEARQARLDEAEACRRDLYAEGAQALPSNAQLRELWPDFTTAEKQLVLGSVFDAIVVRPLGRVAVEQRLVPLYAGDGPSDLPGRGRRVPFGPFALDPPDSAGVPGRKDRAHGPVKRAKRSRTRQPAAA